MLEFQSAAAASARGLSYAPMIWYVSPGMTKPKSAGDLAAHPADKNAKTKYHQRGIFCFMRTAHLAIGVLRSLKACAIEACTPGEMSAAFAAGAPPDLKAATIVSTASTSVGVASRIA